MTRLAQYMGDLARLLGEPQHVHFDRLATGSTILVQTIEEKALRCVETRIRGIESGDAPSDALAAFGDLDRRLAEDDAVGVLTADDGVEIIRFPGRDRPKHLPYGSLRQEGSIEGQLVRIGGKDESVHATLQDGDRTWRCELDREMARRLRNHLFEKPIRVFGNGRWRRDPGGNWNLERFVINGFDVLDDTPWQETVAKLRAIEGAEWREMEDPLGELKLLREGGGEPY